MALRTISILKSYFNTGDKPTESQFGDLIDSFFHKSASIPQSSITDLVAHLEAKVDAEAGKGLSSNDFTAAHIVEINKIANKVDAEAGKGLSSNNFTTTLLEKLNGLSNYTPPTSVEMDYVNGLEQALLGKVNVDDAVQSVNGIGADASGNITIDLSGQTTRYDITESPALMDYSWFGKNVYVVIIPLSSSTTTGEDGYVFPVPDNVDKYVKVEFRSRYGISLIASDTSTADSNSVTFYSGDYTPDSEGYLYVEYTRAVEGISIDEIGTAAIGQDDNGGISQS